MDSFVLTAVRVTGIVAVVYLLVGLVLFGASVLLYRVAVRTLEVNGVIEQTIGDIPLRDRALGGAITVAFWPTAALIPLAQVMAGNAHVILEKATLYALAARCGAALPRQFTWPQLLCEAFKQGADPRAGAQIVFGPQSIIKWSRAERQERAELWHAVRAQGIPYLRGFIRGEARFCVDAAAALTPPVLLDRTWAEHTIRDQMFLALPQVDDGVCVVHEVEPP